MHYIDWMRERLNQMGLQLKEIAARNDCLIRDENGEIMEFERDPKIDYSINLDKPFIDWNAVDISHEMDLIKRLKSKGE